MNITISGVSRCTLRFDKWDLFLRAIVSSWKVFIAGKDGARPAFSQLINVEVLSGGMDGPTVRVPCAPSN